MNDGLGFSLLDGKSLDVTAWDEISLSSFFTGYRVMTTILALKSHLVEFERHMARLQDHLDRFNFGPMPKLEIIRFEIGSLLDQANSPEISRVKLIFFTDELGNLRRMTIVNGEDPTHILKIRETGIRLKLNKDPARERGSHVKTGIVGGRGPFIARAEASGFDDILWLNQEGEVTEATWSNIFLIGRTGDLVEIATPPASSGILEGVTRRRVCELLNLAKIPVTERIITEEEIPRFDEAFVTSSIKGLVPVTQLGSHRMHTLRPQAVFRHISRLYGTWLKTLSL